MAMFKNGTYLMYVGIVHDAAKRHKYYWKSTLSVPLHNHAAKLSFSSSTSNYAVPAT